MASETQTPNIGLQVAAFNQGNWQVPTNYNWNLLDLIFGGQSQVPALSVVDLTVQNFSLANFAALLAASLTTEVPSGAVPGTIYTLSAASVAFMIFCVNGLVLRQSIDFTISGNQVTLASPTSLGDSVYAIYFK